MGLTDFRRQFKVHYYYYKCSRVNLKVPGPTLKLLLVRLLRACSDTQRSTGRVTCLSQKMGLVWALYGRLLPFQAQSIS